MLDEQVAVLKEISDLLLNALLTANKSLRGFRRSSTSHFGRRSRQRFAHLGQRFQNGFGEIRDGMKLAYLVRNLAKDFNDRSWIERRAVGRNSGEGERTGVQSRLEASEEPRDIFMSRVMVKHLVDQPPERVVINNGQNAERAVIQFVRGDIAREVRQGSVKIITGDACDRPFPPPLQPTSES